MNQQDILRMIITKSPAASREAMRAIRAINADSPVVQQRLNQVADLALSDFKAKFSDEERGWIAQLATIIETDSETRNQIVQIRVTPSELTELQLMAENNRMSLSEYIRWELDLFGGKASST